MLTLEAAVVNVLNGQVELVFGVGHIAAVVSTSVGEDAKEAHTLGFTEGNTRSLSSSAATRVGLSVTVASHV